MTNQIQNDQRFRWLIENGTLVYKDGCWGINFPGAYVPGQDIKDVPDIIDCESPIDDMNVWQRAIDDELVSSHLGIADTSDTLQTAKDKLTNLIQWNIDVATDPTVNGGYTPSKIPTPPENICIDCNNSDSWGLPDKPVCRGCVGSDKWMPLNTNSIKPNTIVNEEPSPDELAKNGWQVIECPFCGSYGARAFPKP